MTIRIVIAMLALCCSSAPPVKWPKDPVCREDLVKRVLVKLPEISKLQSEADRMVALEDMARESGPDAVLCALRAYATKDSLRAARVLELLAE